jgi:transposase
LSRVPRRVARTVLRGPRRSNALGLPDRDIRPAKVQQRSSGGCWRTLQGLAEFAIVQSYRSTATKWGISRYDALKRLFTTGAWIPHALTPDTTAA